MYNNKILEDTKKSLKRHNQDHLLAFFEQLNAVQKQNLLTQIQKLDFAKIDDWIAEYIKKPVVDAATSIDLSPAWSYCPDPADTDQKCKYARAEELGRKLISTGKVAAFVVAGGQATRLGLAGPKGNFHISPVKNKTLFQLFAETIVAVSKKYQTTCPWYIMTSPLNHEQTRAILRSNDYYGLDEKDVFIFQQGTLPNFSFDGKIFLADRCNISCSPDGHGGSLKALCESGALADMKRRGVEFVSYFQIDNPLVNVFDPLFIGLHALDKAQMSSKAVLKTEPMEKVGNFCLMDEKVTVVEYSDLPDKLAQKRNPDGSLVFGLGSIAIHILNCSFIEKLNVRGFSLPLHKAVKKIPHIDQLGNHIVASEPNGIKLESFVFDALSLAENSIILQTLRNEEFAPVKNPAGTDSAKTARQLMLEKAANWLESAGVTIPRKSNGLVDCLIEIAPSLAVEKEDIKSKLNQIPIIKPKDKLYIV